MRPTTRPWPARSPPRRRSARRVSGSWEDPQFALVIALGIVEAAAAPDALLGRQFVGLLDQADAGRAFRPRDVLRVGLMPEALDLLGGVVHVFGEHEITMVQQPGIGP